MVPSRGNRYGLRPRYPLLAGIFLCSASALSFEVALTRIFSITLWYHFAFMIISIGMLGLALSGTVQALYPALKNRSYLGPYALFLGISIPLAHILTNMVPFDPVRLQWDKIQFFYIALYYMILAVPFFFFGLIVATSFSEFSEKSGLVYGADLLGAACGAVSVILTMKLVGPERTVFALSFAALAASVIFGGRRIPVLLALISIGIISFVPNISTPRLSPYKDLEVALRYPGAELLGTYQDGYSRVDAFTSPLVRFAPGLSLQYLEPLPPQIGLSVDGSGINAITSVQEDGKSLEFLRHLPSALPYEISERRNALVADPKGGLPVLLAREYGVQNIRSVESNPLITSVIRDKFDEYSGHIYSRETHGGLARSWLKGSAERFDVIDVFLLSSLPSANFGISVDYRFTEEAFHEYLSHLSEDGVLAISTYILPPPRMELRILNTVLDAMTTMGIPAPERNIAAIRSWGSICMVVKTVPLTEFEIGSLKRFASGEGFDLVFYPGIKEEETNIFVKTPENEYHRAFTEILNPSSRDRFTRSYLFDIDAVDDDRPFFNYYLKLHNIKAIYEVIGRKWQFFIQEGYLIPLIFIQALLLSMVVISLPYLARRHERVRPSAGLSYFALLGLGFMFIEVPLIQKMILPFENPSRAVAAVLAGVLVCSGTGSMLSSKIGWLRNPFVLTIIAGVSAGYGFYLSEITAQISAQHISARVLLSLMLILPSGFLMGIPFPLGIRALGTSKPSLIPWAWAVNGCFSVLAPVLAIMIAMTIGFDGVFYIGAGTYALAYIVGRFALFDRQTG